METQGVITISEAAARLKVSRASLYKAIESGKIHSDLILGRRVVRVSDVEAYNPRPYATRRPKQQPGISLGRATALASEKALARLWDTPEEDEAWRDL